MRTIIVGSFVGFVLAAAFLAACGGAGSNDGGGGPAPLTTPGTVKWSALGSNFVIVTGVDLSAGSTWGSSSFYDNRAAGARDQYASFEVMANVGSGQVAVDVGLMPASNGSDYATEPEWLGTVVLSSGSNRRAALSNVRIPPTGFRFALRLGSTGASTIRVLRYSMTPYNTELQ